ncbi:PRC-barrel domain-containing protein [Primorskyibacter sp. S187A]|uniref:PRC-barrel domain-containing protein n=1 Tax=Primorskyibacter sp. S187A TaxID=3415130 RepID=UPI003C7E1831
MIKIFATTTALALIATQSIAYEEMKEGDNSDAVKLKADEPVISEFATDFEIDGWRELKAEWTAEEITGMPLYDTADNWIGEVDDVIVTEAGEISGAVLGVGGFLGIGEKDVLVSFDSLKIKADEDGDDRRVYVDVSKEQLEAMPSYDS